MLPPTFTLRFLFAAWLVSMGTASAQDGERAVLVVDPDRAESVFLAQYYQAAYDIPASHVIYMEPGGASGYAAMVDLQLSTFLATLDERGLDGQIDFVILPPSERYKVSAPGLISDGCVSVQQISLPSAYALARQSGAILAGLNSGQRNHFANASWLGTAFHNATAYRNGNPSTSASAERYFIGTMLGWTGMNGNSVQEILDLVDRSVWVNGSNPAGTVYFMETTDVARSGPRDPLYPVAVTQMTNAGGVGQHLLDVLPLGAMDAMGIMTGAASVDILNTGYALLPGSFADHLTSYAGDLTNNSQTKMTLWLSKGASGTSGAIEEPCNYAGKFPTAALHTSYRLGVTLGEAWFRHLAFYPFQTLFLGDSLVRPYGLLPVVAVTNAPTGPVTGVLALDVTATAAAPGESIASLELWVDGVRRSSHAPAASLVLDTTDLCDGWHDLRVRALDTSEAGFAGVWQQWVQVANQGLSVDLSVNTSAGDLSTTFHWTYAATGSAVDSVTLWRNGRVLATGPSANGVLAVFGQNLGAAEVQVQAEARYSDGRSALSAPVTVQIAYSGTATNSAAPWVFDFERTVAVERPFLIELPAVFDADPSLISYTIETPPTLANPVGGSGSWRVWKAPGTSTGTDTIQYRATGPGGVSNLGTITLHYDNPCPTAYTYCPGFANSTGGSAQLGYLGSTSIPDDFLFLSTNQCPPGAFGLYFYGQNQGLVPSGDGRVCFVSNYQRLPVLQTDAFGTATYQIDFQNPPLPTGLILPGSTWNFQLWYRDTGFGQAGFNFSNALSITFCE